KGGKNPNRAGVEHLGMKPIQDVSILGKVVVAMQRLSPKDVEEIKEAQPKYLILLATNEDESLEIADLVLPTATFAEQRGSFTNHARRVQAFEKALELKGEMLPAWQWMKHLAEVLGKDFNGVNAGSLLKEFFGMEWKDLGAEGKEL
ncbi:MAG: molybdopterin-dependent oxidoreductase, partial [Deltaproteobacteria bacterium]|nr:molybdopterin-dependent oxidoreductase [Deltaproteobacteria bacterium]